MRAALSLLLLVPCLATPARADETRCSQHVSYADGGDLRANGAYYYPNGRAIFDGPETIYYPSGAVFKDGDSTYYPDGKLLQQGVDDLYYPNGVVMRTWNGDSYDFNYDTGKPLVRGEKVYHADGSLAADTEHLSVPVLSYGEIEVTGAQGFVSGDVFLNQLLPGTADKAGGIIPAAGPTPSAPTTLRAIVQWPDQNYRPYYSLIIPTGHGAETAWIDSSGGWTTCNLSDK